MKIRSAKLVAALLTLNLKCYGDEKEKEMTRTAVSADNLADLFGYVDGLIPESDLKQLEIELRQRGFLFMRLSVSQFGLLKSKSTVHWPRLALSRVTDALDLPIEDIERLISADTVKQNPINLLAHEALKEMIAENNIYVPEGYNINDIECARMLVTLHTRMCENHPTSWSLNELQEYLDFYRVALPRQLSSLSVPMLSSIVIQHRNNHNPLRKDSLEHWTIDQLRDYVDANKVPVTFAQRDDIKELRNLVHVHRFKTSVDKNEK